MLRGIIDTYGAPDRTFNDMRQSVQRKEISDPLRNFSEDCRANLRIGPVSNARFGAEVLTYAPRAIEPQRSGREFRCC